MDAIAQKHVQAAFHADGCYFDFSRVWTCDWAEIANYQVTPTSKVDDDVWVVPVHWVSPSARAASARTIDFTRRLPDKNLYPHESFKRRAKRVALLDRFQTLRHGRRSLPAPTASTWVKRTRQFLRAAAYSADNFGQTAQSSQCPEGLSFFSHLDPSQLAELKQSFPAWAIALVARNNALLASGLFDDWPAEDVARHVPPPREDSRASDPFCDLAYSEILRAALWLKSIQDDVLRAFLETKDIRETDLGRRKHSEVQAFRRAQVESWESDRLKIGSGFPFWVQFSGRGMKNVRHESWPLQTVLGLKRLLILCQCANAIIILSSTGMRIGELIAIVRGAMFQRNGEWYLNGAQFKEVDDPAGEVRHWPLPNVAVDALRAQERLADAFENYEALWVMFSGRKDVDSVPALQASLLNFGRCVGLRDGRRLTDIDGEITPHRFRYTVARLVALTMCGASQVLYDVLGHRDMDVTLGYALRDPELHEEINRIRAEVKAVQSSEIFNETDHLGGPAATLVRRIKADFLSRSGEADLDTEDMAEAAAILGEAEIVREGVLCTAQPLERGACSSSLGIRDHSACTPECLHRLETAAYVADRRKKIEFILSKFASAELADQVFYTNQLCANFVAAPQLVNEFEGDPRLASAISAMHDGDLLKLPEALRERLLLLGGKAL